MKRSAADLSTWLVGRVAALTGVDPGGIDPQLRLLLETSWEALERAGIVPGQLVDSTTGVFMGLIGHEYAARTLRDLSTVDAYDLLGAMHSSMVGRLSYVLGMKGPNMSIDTACSSSPVAVHLACQALRSGESSLVLAGSAHVTLDPAAVVIASRLRALSPTGRYHAFSAAADGYVRSEGAAVVVLERLSDALRNGHLRPAVWDPLVTLRLRGGLPARIVHRRASAVA